MGLLYSCISPLLLCTLLAAQAPEPPINREIEKVTTDFQKKIHHQDLPRAVSFERRDWPFAANLVIVQIDNLPIVAQPSLTDYEVEILGIAKRGEVFESIGCQERVKLINPLGNEINDSGLWCRVRLLDGKQGWILAKASQETKWYLLAAPGVLNDISSSAWTFAGFGLFAIVVTALVVRSRRMGKSQSPKPRTVPDFSYSNSGTQGPAPPDSISSELPREDSKVDFAQYREAYNAAKAEGPLASVIGELLAPIYTESESKARADAHAGRPFDPEKKDG